MGRPKHHLTTGEYAKLHSIPYRTLYGMICDGRVTVKERNGSLYIHKDQPPPTYQSVERLQVPMVDVVPEGYVDVATFAQQHQVTYRTASLWVRLGRVQGNFVRLRSDRRLYLPPDTPVRERLVVIEDAEPGESVDA